MNWFPRLGKGSQGTPLCLLFGLTLFILFFTLAQSSPRSKKEESDLVFEDNDGSELNLILSEKSNRNRKVENAKHNPTNTHSKSRFHWFDTKYDDAFRGPNRNRIPQELNQRRTSSVTGKDGVSHGSTPSYDTESSRRRTARVPDTDDEDLIYSGEFGSGDTDHYRPPATTRRSDAPTGFEKRFFRVTVTIERSWSPALELSTSSVFRVYSSEVEQQIQTMGMDIEGFYLIRFENIDDPRFVRCVFDLGLVGMSTEQVEEEFVTYLEVGSIGSLKVRREGFSVRDVGGVPPEICLENQITCRNGKCLDILKRCNGRNDCGDNSDEEGCSSTVPPTTTTPRTVATTTRPRRPIHYNDSLAGQYPGIREGCRADDQVRCSPNGPPIFICADQLCDGTPNCPRGEDESPEKCPENGCSPAQFQCDLSKCISLSQRCDGRSDCFDGKDEQNCDGCPRNQFRCSDGTCLDRQYVCDGIFHCTDDEIRDCPCSKDQFQCDNGVCIPISLQCDKRFHCNDKSDESERACSSKNTTQPVRCSSTQFQCRSGECIERRRKCDRRQDCRDGSDEINCPTTTTSTTPAPAICMPFEFQCTTSRECIHRSLECDNSRDCRDGSDEGSHCKPVPGRCSSSEFRCGDGTCISLSRRCNGRRDCLDGIDENDCGQIQCRPDQFRCSQTAGGCIPRSSVCDQIVDCDATFADENDCEGSCREGEFSCGDGSCIPIGYVCDKYFDCTNKNDEVNCTTGPPPKPECQPLHQFTCLAGLVNCIDINFRCNKIFDCEDGSDEHNCDAYATTPRPSLCGRNEVPCRSGGQCIPQSLWCNGNVECNDFSDEQSCGPIVSPGGSLNIKTYPAEQTIRQGHEVVFQCRDEGPSRVPVRWTSGTGLSLPPGSRDFNGRLEMPNISMEHTGTYICQAVGYPESTPGSRVSVYLKVDNYQPPPTRPPSACGLHQATCGNGECISKNMICDGDLDCSDGSDEQRCHHGKDTCEPNEFRCGGHEGGKQGIQRCIPKNWRCDGDDDCGDSSDESGCTAPPVGSRCRHDEFTCTQSHQCIPKAFHCDKELDCTDRSDEMSCSSPIIHRNPPPLITIGIGQWFNISCTAVGQPIPEIVWRLNWGHIPSKCVTSSASGVGFLSCPDIQITDQGAYSCEAINTLGSTFALPDCILVVEKGPSVCPIGSFNDLAVTSRECLSCFCFGHTTECSSTKLYISQMPPPEFNFRVVGVSQDLLGSGQVEIQDRSYIIPASVLRLSGRGVQISIPNVRTLAIPEDIIPYFALPPSYNGNLLKAFGGHLRYNLKYRGSGRPLRAPDVIVNGNGITLLHVGKEQLRPGLENAVAVRFWPGEWFKRVLGRPGGDEPAAGVEPASREEILMVLANVEYFLIRAQYDQSSTLDTTLSEVKLDNATPSNVGQGAAVYIEECRCPAGYIGFSCEDCAPGYERYQQGPWLGNCMKSSPSIICPRGTYSDQQQCRPCPCPTEGRRHGSSCYKDTDGNVTCECNPGHVGRNCQGCAPGYQPNPNYPYDCRPAGVTCDVDGSVSPYPDPITGRCICKEFVTGSSCNQCQEATFYLKESNQYGCVSCFCMGITNNCQSSSWYRTQEASVFVNSPLGFTMVDESQRNVIREGFIVERNSRELGFNRYPADIYYWQLPYNYLGNKVTSYGGYLNYTIRYVPPPGGHNSPNTAADVELNGQDIRLLYFRKIPVSPNKPVEISVPFTEAHWQRQDGQIVNREHLMMALSNIDALLVKATYTTSTRESYISNVKMTYAVQRNTGMERAYAVEQCSCPVGYEGLSCEECAFGYTRSLDGLYLGLCEKCSCNNHSDECDPKTGVCRNCRDYTTGDFCDTCEDGYTGNPRVGGCRPIEGGRCDCNVRGSISQTCTDGRNCLCKGNVEGHSCNLCRRGTFSLQESNPLGCSECFCSSVTSDCASATLYRSVISWSALTLPHGLALTDSLRTLVIFDFSVDTNTGELSYTYPYGAPTERLFWSLPPSFTGNRITSYGGKLRATRRYLVQPGTSDTAIEDIDVIIVGNNGVSLFWTYGIRAGQEVSLEVVLKETAGWRHLEGASNIATRDDLLGVLSEVRAILIRASFTDDMEATYIKDISLDDAVKHFTPNGLVDEVEECKCPEGHSGLSCESCVSGYYRDANNRARGPGGVCVRCPCGVNSEGCAYENGQVQCLCRPGFSGPSCESRDKLVVELYPVKVKSFLGSVEEFTCSYTYNSSERFRIEFLTFPEWSWLVAEMNIRAFSSKGDPHPPGMNFPQPEWGHFLTARIPILPKLQRVICRLTSESGDTVAEVFSAISPAGTTPITYPTTPDREIDVQISEPAGQTIPSGSTASFRCSGHSSASSQLRVTWSREFGELPYGRSRDDGRGLLVITSARPEDSGRYVCSVTDGIVTSIATTSFNVGGAGQPSFGAKPSASISPRYATVRVGEPVEFQCASSGIPVPSVTWLTSRGPVPSHISVVGSSLRIPAARKSDAMEYICSARNNAGTESSRATLYVQGEESQAPTLPPFGLVVSITPTTYEARPGEIVRFRCDTAERNALLQWSKLSGVLPHTASQSPDGTLTLHSVRDVDSGIYVCSAASESGQSTQAQARLTVSFIGSPPSAKITPERQTVAQGSPIEIRCNPTGNPQPTVEWSKVGGALPPGVQKTNEVLRIDSADVSDRGVYVCQIENSAGKGLASAIVEVERRESPQIEMYPSGRQTVVRDGSALFQCRVTSGIPSPVVTWSRGDGRVFPRNVEEIEGGVLRFNRVTGEEKGQYICRAENIVGTTSAVATLDIQSLPNITITPTSPHRVRTGQHVRLECKADAEPFASVSWIKMQTGRDQQEDRERLHGNGTPFFAIYDITRVSKTDEGSYSCLAKNEAGQSEERLQLLVDDFADTEYNVIQPYYPTSGPSQREETFYFPVGSRAELRCIQAFEGDVFNRVYLDWNRADGGRMPRDYDVNDGILAIEDLSREDAGTYSCTGRSRQGDLVFTMTARLEVIGTSPPHIQLEPARQTVRRGDTVTINCITSGDGPITSRWERMDRRPFPPSVLVTGQQIVFRGIEVSDTGRYMCSATNSGGTTEAVAEVTVNTASGVGGFQPGTGNIGTPRREQRGVAGSTVELRCGISGSQYNWRKEEEGLPRSSIMLGPTLTLLNLQLSDAGRYICESEDGIDYIDLSVEVGSYHCGRDGWLCLSGDQCISNIYKCDSIPHCKDYSDELECGRRKRSMITMTRGMEDVNVRISRILPSHEVLRVGDDLELNCLVENDPDPQIRWSKVHDGQFLENVQMFGNLLTIRDVRYENGGVYRCTASTHGGIREEDYAVTIQANPDRVQNSAPVQTRSVPYGSTVTMDCKSDLPSRVEYSWSKQGGIINQQLALGQSITISDATAESSGVYVCTMKNSVTSSDVTTVLVVSGVVPQFQQNGYMQLPTLPDSYLKFEIEISFKPEDRNGLILYNGQMKDGTGDFISFGLSNGYPEFRFDVGSGPAVIRGDQLLEIGKWHTVLLMRNRANGKLIVNDEQSFNGTVHGTRFQGLDLMEPLFIGGYPNFQTIHRLAGHSKGFTGCISEIKIGGKRLQLFKDVTLSRGVSSCDTCTANECTNNGVCQEGLSARGYSCICPPGYSGDNCEVIGVACHPGACGTGRCVNTQPGGLECYCPFGKAGNRCERDVAIHEPQFGANSWISYPSPQFDLRKFKVTLKVKPEAIDTDAILMYASQTNEGLGDFMALAIKDKKFEFIYDTGSGPAFIRSKKAIMVGEWMTITAERNLQDGKLTIDGDHAEGKSPGQTRGLNLKTPLFLGGYDRNQIQLNSHLGGAGGFLGCVSEINVEDMEIDLVNSVLEAANVDNCGGSFLCTKDKGCKNGGVCENNATCNCLPGFSGIFCETVDICARKPCQNGGQCFALKNTYRCSCAKGFFGTNCETAMGNWSQSVAFRGEGYIELDKSRMARRGPYDPEKVEIEISTKVPAGGLLLWHGPSPAEVDPDDFFSIGINGEGKVELQWDYGAGVAKVVSNKAVNDGEKHLIVIKRQGADGTIQVDGEEVPAFAVNSDPVQVLNPRGNIYVGGTPNPYQMTHGMYHSGFVGCIHSLKILTDEAIDLNKNAVSALNTGPCSDKHKKPSGDRGPTPSRKLHAKLTNEVTDFDDTEEFFLEGRHRPWRNLH